MASTDTENERWWRAWHRTGSTSVFHVDLTPCALWEQHACQRLNSEEQLRRAQIHSVRRRREFSLCRAALRAIVCQFLGCPNRELSFGESRYGKPFALVAGTKAPVSFNVSHSGLHGLIAVAPSGRVGVDVEERLARPDLEGTVRTVMSPSEVEMLSAFPRATRHHQLYRIWTLKEALAKALGLGFSLDLTEFSIPSAILDGGRIGEIRLPHEPTVRWHVGDLSNSRYAAALVVELSRNASVST